MSDTPEQNPPVSESNSWTFGPGSAVLFLVLIIANFLAAVVRQDVYSYTWYGFCLGLTFGQAGAVAIRVYSQRVHRRGIALLVAVVASLALGLLSNRIIDGSDSGPEFWSFALLFLIYSFIILALMLVWQLAKHHFAPNGENWYPQFRLMHLLLATVAVAFLGVIIRYAGPHMAEWFDWTTLWIISLFSFQSIAAGVVLMDHKIHFVRLGVFAAITLVVYVALEALAPDQAIGVVALVQAVVLTAATLLPQIDRYKIHVWFEPPDMPAEPMANEQTDVEDEIEKSVD